MPRLLPRMLLLTVLLLPTPLLAQLRFVEGKHFAQVPVPQATGLAPAGRIEVIEVFSYVCGGCNSFRPQVEQLARALPPDAVMTYVHAGFNSSWPVFQRAHLTAQQLGIADRHHSRLFDAIWRTASFPYFDPATGRPRNPAPVIRDFARFYAGAGGVSEAAFASAATSARIEAAIRRTDALIKGWQVPHTPSLIVAGRWLINNDELTTQTDLDALVAFLVSRERARLKNTTPARN